MTLPLSDFEELRALIDALCEDSITAEQVRRLEELVLTHPEAEAYYVQYMSLYADLSGHFGVIPGRKTILRDDVHDRQRQRQSETQSDEERRATARSSRFSLTSRLITSVSAIAAGLILAVLLWPRPQTIHIAANPDVEEIDETVAVLVQAPGARWEGTPMRAGAPLSPGWLRLASGFAHIEFYNGAMVILEGPADFKLISRTEGYCARGKLRAVVPAQAHGFTIGSPKLDLVDRGTEFGLRVEEGKTEVHVFQGRVELHKPASKRQAAQQELTTGQGVRLDGPGIAQAIESDPTLFRTAEELADHSLAELRLRQNEWVAASKRLRADPNLLLYYTFETENLLNRTLHDQAGSRKQPRDGAIVGCQWVSGRWPAKKGLEFKRVSDRVRVHVPGEYTSLTLMAWVRVDALPNQNNSLFMADGWEEGEIHWQIGRTGTIILGVQSDPKGRGGHYHATDVLTADRFGQWLHLAVVYDRDNGQVTHYVDGQLAAQATILFDIPLRIGDAQIGNWDVAAHRNNTPVRNFNGCMDEFMLFSRALNENEIRQRYAEGRPPS